MPTATRAAQHGAAAPAGAAVTETVADAFSPTGTVTGDLVARSIAALDSLLRSAAGKARELSDGFAAEVRKVTGPAVTGYRQTGHHLGDPTAWV